jgi:hypothetical protein
MGLLLVLPSLPRTPVFSVQSQGNLIPCHLGPGGRASPLQLYLLFIPSSRTPTHTPFPRFQGQWEGLAGVSKIRDYCNLLSPEPRTLKHLLSLHTPASLPAVASVYREISYWPRPFPQSTVLPGPPFSSGTAQALITPIPRGGISLAPRSQSGAYPKGFLDLLMFLALEERAPPRLAPCLWTEDSRPCGSPHHRALRSVLALCTAPPIRPRPHTAGCRALSHLPRLKPAASREGQ